MISPAASLLADLIRGLFEALRKADLPFLVLRNYHDLPHATTNDVDLLIPPERLGEAESILAQVAAKVGWVVHNRARFSPVSLFLHHPGTLQQIQIDYFINLQWRGTDLLGVNEVFQAAGSCNGFPVPHPAHEALLNLTGRLLPYGRVREKYREGIAEAALEQGEELEASLAGLFGVARAHRIVAHCREADWKAIEAMAGDLRRALIVSRPLRVLAGWVAMACRLAVRFLRPPGLWVVFLGPDGSGKSTCLTTCEEGLANSFNPGKNLHIHWKPVPFRRPRRGAAAPNLEPHGQAPRPGPVALAYLVGHAVQFILGHWTVVKPALFRNGMVFFDRHYLDFLVDPRRYRLSVPRGVIRWLGRWLPQPDLILVLDAPSGVLLARKSEVSSDECLRQVEAYRSLAGEFTQARLLDATRPPAQVGAAAVREVLAHLARRTARRHPWLGAPGGLPGQRDAEAPSTLVP